MGAITKAQPLANGTPLNPLVGGRAFAQPFDFTSQTSIAYTLATDMSRGIDNVQSVFIDNSNSNAPFYMNVFVTGETIVCPPYSQGFFPVLFPTTSNFQCTCKSAGATVVTVQFMNMPMDLNIWSVTSPAAAGIQTVQGSLAVYSSPGVWTPRSGAIAAAAQSQLLAPANGTRRRFFIRNPYNLAGQNIANFENLFFNFTSAAGVDDGISFELAPGETYDSGLGSCSTEAIYVTAATQGHRFISREM